MGIHRSLALAGGLGRRGVLGLGMGLLAGLQVGRAGGREKLVLLLPSAPTVPAFAPLVLAQHLGFYADAGLDVELIMAKGGVDVAKQVGVGNAELGTAIGDTAIIVRSNGIPVKIVALLGGGSMTTIVARPDRGIRTIADLKGKKVAVLSFQDTTYFALLGALATVGLDKSDIDAEALGPAGVTNLVLSGHVDACACVPEREVAILNAIPDAVSIPTTEFIPSMAQALIASDTIIARNPELVRSAVHATLRGVQYIVNDPAHAARSYAAAVPPYQDKVPLVQQIMERYIARAYNGQSKLGQVDPERLAKLQSFYLKETIISRTTAVSDLYTNEFLS
jgi:NitT/TauT family transport system substrate-binding protein